MSFAFKFDKYSYLVPICVYPFCPRVVSAFSICTSKCVNAMLAMNLCQIVNLLTGKFTDFS